MTRQLYFVTAFETARVTRAYKAASKEEAVEKMAAWTRKQEEDRGRQFSGTFRVDTSADN